MMWAEQGGDRARAATLYAQAQTYLPEFVTANIHLAELEVALDQRVLQVTEDILLKWRQLVEDGRKVGAHVFPTGPHNRGDSYSLFAYSGDARSKSLR
jgi:hypothetical protein